MELLLAMLLISENGDGVPAQAISSLRARNALLQKCDAASLVVEQSEDGSRQTPLLFQRFRICARGKWEWTVHFGHDAQSVDAAAEMDERLNSSVSTAGWVYRLYEKTRRLHFTKDPKPGNVLPIEGFDGILFSSPCWWAQTLDDSFVIPAKSGRQFVTIRRREYFLPEAFQLAGWTRTGESVLDSFDESELIRVARELIDGRAVWLRRRTEGGAVDIVSLRPDLNFAVAFRAFLIADEPGPIFLYSGFHRMGGDVWLPHEVRWRGSDGKVLAEQIVEFSSGATEMPALPIRPGTLVFNDAGVLFGVTAGGEDLLDATLLRCSRVVGDSDRLWSQTDIWGVSISLLLGVAGFGLTKAGSGSRNKETCNEAALARIHGP